jgi:hypothetical protein
MADQRLVRLIEDVLPDIIGRRIATETARRLAAEIVGDGYVRIIETRNTEEKGNML